MRAFVSGTGFPIARRPPPVREPVLNVCPIISPVGLSAHAARLVDLKELAKGGITVDVSTES